MNRRNRFWAALCAAFLFFSFGWPFRVSAAKVPDYAASGRSKVVGYLGGWASDQGFSPQDLPAHLLTHINYAFAGIDPVTNSIVLESPERDRKNLAELRKLREKYPHLKLLISVGGWDDSTYFSDVASTAARREAFAKSCLALVREHGLDGVDLDWEYPVSGGPAGTSHRPEDRENFTLLLRALRDKLGTSRSLTVAGAAGAGYLEHIEPEAVSGLVDHIFLMAYDLHGPWDDYADFNAPLYIPSGASPQYKLSVAGSLQAYLDKGVPAEKLVLGMPLYGTCYRGVSAANNGLYSRFSSAFSIPYRILERDYLSDPSYRKGENSEVKAPYLYKSGTFLTYETPGSIAAKGKLASEKSLSGIGFWELSQDRRAALVTSACAAFTEEVFADVLPGDWFFDEVEYVSQLGLMNGTSTTTFSSSLTVKRGMMAVILHRMAGTPSPGWNSGTFSDVSESAYYAKAVAWTSSKDLMNGYGEDPLTGAQRFGPENTLTREQLAAVLFRFASWQGRNMSKRKDLSGYADVKDISPYAKTAMEWAAAEGLITGRTGSLLVPKGTATRAETAAVLTRFLRGTGNFPK